MNTIIITLKSGRAMAPTALLLVALKVDEGQDTSKTQQIERGCKRRREREEKK